MSFGIIGIDPGLHGGLALLVDGQVHLRVMPAIAVGVPKRKDRVGGHVLDAPAFYMVLEMLIDHAHGLTQSQCKVFVEKVHSMPDQGVSSAFKFGKTCGVIEGVLAGMAQPFTMVTPRSWQAVIHQGVEGEDPKRRSLIAVSRLFPRERCLATDRSKVPHSGLVDALLIAEYGRRSCGREELADRLAGRA